MTFFGQAKHQEAWFDIDAKKTLDITMAKKAWLKGVKFIGGVIAPASSETTGPILTL